MSHILSFSSVVAAAQRRSLKSGATRHAQYRQLMDDLQVIIGARSAGAFVVLCYLAHELATEIRATLAVVQSH
jgi:hypothetical protein